jgi:phospholipid transport system substrate-binding protein
MLPRPLHLLSALALLLALTAPAGAGPPTEELRTHVDEVIRIVSDPALRARPLERHREVRKIAEDIFDYPDTARRALGIHWRERTPAERRQFVRLFADLLDRAYVSKIDLYENEQVQYTGEVIEGAEATVKTQITTKSGSTVPVDYRMHLVDGRWLVYDVVIEGVSLVANYRAQFNKVISTESYRALVQRMTKVAESEPAASPKSRER